MRKKTIKIWLQYLIQSPLYRLYDITLATVVNIFFNDQNANQIPVDEISENTNGRETHSTTTNTPME